MKVTVVPFDYPLEENPENIQYDGIFLSNGPGDPQMCQSTVESVKARDRELCLSLYVII